MDGITEAYLRAPAACDASWKTPPSPLQHRRHSSKALPDNLRSRLILEIRMSSITGATTQAVRPGMTGDVYRALMVSMPLSSIFWAAAIYGILQLLK